MKENHTLYYLKYLGNGNFIFYIVYFEQKDKEKVLSSLNKEKNKILFCHYKNKNLYPNILKPTNLRELTQTQGYFIFKYNCKIGFFLDDILKIRYQINKQLDQNKKLRTLFYRLNILQDLDGSFVLYIKGYKEKLIPLLLNIIKNLKSNSKKSKTNKFDKLAQHFLCHIKNKNNIETLKKALIDTINNVKVYPKDFVIKKYDNKYILYKKSNFVFSEINKDYLKFLKFVDNHGKTIKEIISFFEKNSSNEKTAINIITQAIEKSLLTIHKDKKGKMQIIDFSLNYNLDLVMYEVTKQCNFNCIHCYNNSGLKKEKEYSLDEFAKSLTKFKKMGVFEIYFTGGEPLMRPLLKKMIIETHKKNLWYSIFTNGSQINESWIDFFKKYRPRNIIISLDSVNEYTFKKIRKYDVKKIEKNIENLRKEGIEVRINTILFKGLNTSTKELYNLFSFCKENGITHIIIDTLVLFGRGTNLKKYQIKN